MPFQPPALRVERDDRVRVQIVARTIVADQIGRRIPRRPVQRVELRIVGAGQPRRGAGMRDALALPRLRRALARRRRGPEAPRFLPRLLVERRDEAAHAFVAARRAGDDQIAEGERRAGGVVVLMPVGHLRVPQQRAGEAVEADDVRMIGDHEHAIAGDRDAAIDAAGRVADEPLGARPLVVPDLAARAGVERVALVRARHVHHPADDDRRHLQPRRVGQAEDPLRHEARHVLRRDLRERARAIAARRAVVAGPVLLRRDGAVAIAALPEKMDPAIVADELQIGRALIDDEAAQRAAAGERDRRVDLAGPAARPQRPEMPDEIRDLRVADVRERRHAGARQAAAHDGGELFVGPRRDAAGNRGTELAAAAVGAVARRAAAREDLPAGIGRLEEREEARCDERGEQHGGRHGVNLPPKPPRLYC